MRPQGNVEAIAPQSTYADEQDAVEDLNSALSSVPGLDFIDGQFTDDRNVYEDEVNGHTVRYTYAEHDIGVWSATVEVDEESTTLLSEYDEGLNPRITRPDRSWYYPNAHRLALETHLRQPRLRPGRLGDRTPLPLMTSGNTVHHQAKTLDTRACSLEV